MIVSIPPAGAMEKEIRGLLREVKRARLFEIQRLVRRIRQLAHKKGTDVQLKKNQRKIERFEKELEFLKDAEMASIIRKITNKEDKDSREIDEVIEDWTHADIDLRNRALDRIINSKTLQKFLEKLSASEESSVVAEQRKGSIDAARATRALRKNVKLKTSSAKSIPTGKSRQKEEYDDKGSIDAGIRKKQKQQKAKQRKDITSNTLTSVINPNIKPAELKEDENCAILPGSDCSESDFEDADADDISSLEIKPKGLESCFVQTMSGLEKESLVAKSKQGREKGKVVNKKGKKNRKGQRARQKTWEKVHGKNAKHLLKKKIELSSKETEGTKGHNVGKTQHSLKRKSDNESLHPSWEATKRRRLQETLKIEFKGQRIRFDD